MSVSSALVRFNEGGEVVNEIPGEPWMYGVFAFGVLLLLLFLVTRLNPDR